MISFSTTVYIENKGPHEIYNWWLNLDNRKYIQWHKEHLFWEWSKEKSSCGTLGSKLRFGEIINNRIILFRGKVSGLKENRFIEFTHDYMPVKVHFNIEPYGEGSYFHYNLSIGFSGAFGNLLDIFLRIGFPRKHFGEALLKHVHEENNSIP